MLKALPFRSFLFVIPQLFVCHSAAFCLSFRSEAEESAFALACPFLFVIPQIFVCHSAAKRRNLLLPLPVPFCLSFPKGICFLFAARDTTPTIKML